MRSRPAFGVKVGSTWYFDVHAASIRADEKVNPHTAALINTVSRTMAGERWRVLGDFNSSAASTRVAFPNTFHATRNGSPDGTPVATQLSGSSLDHMIASDQLKSLHVSTNGWEEVLAPSDPQSPVRSVVRREAVGVVAAVIPWNSPFSSATSKIIPALLAGNSVILKVSPENSLSMGFLAELLKRAGLPEGVISVLPADRETSEHLVSHKEVDKIAFTGSTRAGRHIAAIACERLKRVSLELGGKSAAIILPDADIEKAVAGVRFGSLLNNGESCIAQTRILAPRHRYEEVVAALKELVESLRVGDPSDPDTFIGPMIRPDQQQRVRDCIRLGIEEGARLVTGGPQIPAGLEKGNYVTPTVFADVDNAMRIAQEEIFGPVLVVIAYDDEDDAVRIANDSEYGLSGGVWSADEERALAVARRVRTGTVTVNGASVGFDGPFGGFKASGIGREYGAVGLGACTEYQTITV
ncbi:aldehyde dehydrogenase family protein [Streptomyces spectabilis]|uniref:aldehyde dehydrogenase family protein n=1 Tax=Streptomyces spectabilis TaxID=68270 RepID=UPI0039A72076